MLAPHKMKTVMLIAFIVVLFYPSTLNGWPLSCTTWSCPKGQVCTLKTLPCLIAPCPVIPTCTEQKCPNGQPLQNSNGQEIFCGRGPAHQDCPDSHACNIHPTDRFAVCCRKPGPPRTCENTECPPGQFCEMLPVVCKTAPCPRVPTCVAKCPHGKPLQGSDGDEIFCGMGPSSQPCPPTHTCHVHPTDWYAVCCPKTVEPVCRHGAPHKIPGPDGSLINFQCAGFAGIACPAMFECVVTAPGADRFGICCPPACPAGLVYNSCGTACPPTCEDPDPDCIEICIPGCFCPSNAPIQHNGMCIPREKCPPTPPVCRYGDPHKTRGPQGGMIDFQCGGIAGIRCPPGYDCIITAPGSDRFGVCCQQEKVCPRGKPYTNPGHGQLVYCGGMLNMRCPRGYICLGGRPEVDEPGVCCEEAGRCFLPKEPGPCRGSFLKWYYDERSTDCLSFTYGGCQGNENRFDTEDECVHSCRCSLPKDPGPCEAAMPRWYYDTRTRTCQPFTYGGCHGNGNRFDTLADCKSTCPEKKVCPSGRPYINRDTGDIFQCGGFLGIPCPSGYTCIPDGPGADRTGTCCRDVRRGHQ